MYLFDDGMVAYTARKAMESIVKMHDEKIPGALAGAERFDRTEEMYSARLNGRGSSAKTKRRSRKPPVHGSYVSS